MDRRKYCFYRRLGWRQFGEFWLDYMLVNFIHPTRLKCFFFSQVTACTIKCIETGVTRPTGVFPVYGVFLSQYTACPSRFQSFYDTIISYNVYNAIFSAYHGVRGSKTLGKNEIFEDKSVEKLTNEKATNYLCSPYYAPDEILKMFPPTTILSTNIDPCLDECVEFAKRLRSNNTNMKFTGESKIIRNTRNHSEYIFRYV